MATFNSNILVAGATSPALASAPLSAVGVTYLSGANVPFQTVEVTFGTIGAEVAGFAFNAISLSATAETAFTTRNLVSFPLVGTTVYVPKSMHGAEMALILKPVNNVQRSILTTFLSAAAESAFASVSSFSTDSTPNTRRLWTLGYL